jgi:hypothetical protein
LLFIGGIGGWYPERRKEAGDAKVQMRSICETMKAALEKGGLFDGQRTEGERRAGGPGGQLGSDERGLR